MSSAFSGHLDGGRRIQLSRHGRRRRLALALAGFALAMCAAVALEPRAAPARARSPMRGRVDRDEHAAMSAHPYVRAAQKGVEYREHYREHHRPGHGNRARFRHHARGAAAHNYGEAKKEAQEVREGLAELRFAVPLLPVFIDSKGGRGRGHRSQRHLGHARHTRVGRRHRRGRRHGRSRAAIKAHVRSTVAQAERAISVAPGVHLATSRLGAQRGAGHRKRRRRGHPRHA